MLSGLRKTFKSITKGVKKVVNGVGKAVKKVYKGTKKLLKNKYVRMALLITAAATIPGAIALAAPALSSVAVGAITGAVVGAGGGILAGEKPKEWLTKGAVGAATGAAFAKIGESIKAAQNAKSGVEGAQLDVSSSDITAQTESIAPLDVKATMPDPLDLGDPTSGLNENIAQLASDTPVVPASEAIESLNIAPATSAAESTALETFKEGAKDFGIRAAESLAIGTVDAAIQQRLMGDPESIGAFGAGLGEETGTNLTPFEIAYQNAGINITDAYKNLTFGSGDISNYIPRETELFRQETIQVT